MKSRHSSALSTAIRPVTACAAPGASLAPSTASPGRRRVFDGMQAQYEHSPPTSSRSAIATRMPPSASSSAHTSPAGPAPITMASYIAINGRAAARREIGGVERYTREMVTRLPALGDYRVVTPPTAHKLGQLWEQALPLMHRGLIYSPANTAPISSRTVVVIHDVAAIRHPEWYSRTYAAWHNALLPRVARKARLVITVSEFSRDEIAEVLGVDSVVVPGGVDERFKPGEPRDYVLTVATRIARKNLAALEQTRRALAERGIELVAVG